jgi:protein FAM50
MTFYKGDAREATRAIQLQKRRQQQQEDVEIKKKKIEEESKMTSIDNKFKAHYDAVEQMLRTDTIGLVTLEDMKKKRELIIQQREQQLAQQREQQLQEENAKREKKLMQKTECQKLSFAHDDDDDDDGEQEEEDTKDKEQEKEQEDKEMPPPPPPQQEQESSLSLFKTKKRFGKNPHVDTSFLPDKDRDFAEDLLREQLRREWVDKQEKLKNEQIEIVYSYWDGTGHRRTAQLKKGQTIQQFLSKCLEQLRKENQFNELKTSAVDQLMYVKEDIILPHHYTFYDLIVTKARGKSGPLFLFDCHDDVRIVSDATVEKEESHAGKVILRSWYERHKHIFPASRWEPFDPLKKWEGYTVKD